MSRAVPLLVNILVATFTGIRFHKILARNLAASGHLRGTGEEIARRAISFLFHNRRRHGGVLNASSLFPTCISGIERRCTESSKKRETDRRAQKSDNDSAGKPAAPRHPSAQQKRASH